MEVDVWRVGWVVVFFLVGLVVLEIVEGIGFWEVVVEFGLLVFEKIISLFFKKFCL